MNLNFVKGFYRLTKSSLFILIPLIACGEENVEAPKWDNFKTPKSIEIEKKCLSNESPFYKRAKEHEEAEKRALVLIKTFFEKDELNNDYTKFKENLKILLNELEEIYNTLGTLQPSEKVLEQIKDKGDLVFCKYKEQMLKLDGMAIKGSYPGLYYAFFEHITIKEHPNSNSHKSLMIRYKIKLNDEYPYSLEDLTNVFLVLLNKDGFELSHHFIGKIKEGAVVTGKFEISEDDYRELYTVRFITDQDRGHEINL